MTETSITRQFTIANLLSFIMVSSAIIFIAGIHDRYDWMKESHNLSLSLSVTLFVVLGISHSLQHYMIKRIALGPIARFCAHVRQIIGDDRKLGEQIPQLSNSKEITYLIHAFNDLSRHLRKERDSLVDLVRQRTKELEEANLKMQHDLTDITNIREIYRALLDAIPSPVFLIGNDRKIIELNAAGKALGAKEGDYCWCGIHGMTAITDDERQAFISTGAPLPGTQCSFCHADDAVLQRCSTYCEADVNGRIWENRWVPVGENNFLHYAIDITKHITFEQELVRSHEFLAAILDCIQDGVVACDKDGFLNLFNRSSRSIHGIPMKPLPPEQWSEYYDQYEADGITRMKTENIPLFRALQGDVVNNQEMVVIPKSGHATTLMATGRQLVDPYGNKLGAVVSLHDVTKIKVLEEHLRQAQKMESIGTLAGGVAHDFNNILTVIMSACTLLNLKMKHDDELGPIIAQILNSSERAAMLTHSLLAFSRKQAIRPRPANLNDIIMGMKEFLERIIGEDIQFETDLCPYPLPVFIDRNQIEQVFMNLATNARDAMPNGGAFRIASSIVTHDGRCVDMEGIRHGSYAMITLSDNGPGIDKTVQTRIFEPFFTTKELGRGTGLGLSIVYGIIRQHEGTICVSSRPGKGTVFKMYLPLGAPAVWTGESLNSSEAPSGNETILLIEDDADVLTITAKLLERYGYKVLAAANGEEALHLYDCHQGEISLVILDVIMPGMNGKEVLERLLAFDPAVNVLFASGYTADIIQKKGVVEEDVHFVHKPFDNVHLLTKIREMIDMKGAKKGPSAEKRRNAGYTGMPQVA